MTHTSSRKVGAIFPVLEEHVSNIFNGDHDVFVKFTKMKLKKGILLIFYVSRKKVLMGQAKIKNVEKLHPNVAWSLYNNRIFLNHKEYKKYVEISPISGKKRKMKEISAFTLTNIKKYDTPVLSTLAVTSAGRYISKREYHNILKD